LREHVDSLDGSVASYAGSEVLEAVWRETLRLHPVITEVLRTCEEPMTLGDVEIPAGDVVSASICLVHLDPSLYPDPHRFDPNRFIGTKHPPYEYLPFGGGHRRCLGAAFAGYQLQVVLGVLLRDYQVQLQESTPPPPVRSNVTIAPKGEVPVVIERR
jgi:cytochrome P450